MLQRSLSRNENKLQRTTMTTSLYLGSSAVLAYPSQTRLPSRTTSKLRVLRLRITLSDEVLNTLKVPSSYRLGVPALFCRHLGLAWPRPWPTSVIESFYKMKIRQRQC